MYKRQASVSYNVQPLLAGYSQERIADTIGQASREVELKQQEFAREGKTELIIPEIRGLEPIAQLSLVLKNVRNRPRNEQAALLEEYVSGSEGEAIQGIFRRGQQDVLIESLDNYNNTIYKSALGMESFYAVFIEVKQAVLAFGYTLIDAVTPALKPFLFAVYKLAQGLKWVTENAGVVSEILGTFFVGAVILAVGALVKFAVTSLAGAVSALTAFITSVVLTAASMLGLNIVMAPIAIIGLKVVAVFLVLAAVIGGLIWLLGRIPGLDVPRSGGNEEGSSTNISQANTFNISGSGDPSELAQNIDQELGNQIGGSLLGVPR